MLLENYSSATEATLISIIADVLSIPGENIKVLSVSGGDNSRRRLLDNNGVVVEYEVELMPGPDREVANDAVAILEDTAMLTSEITAHSDFATSFAGFSEVKTVETPSISTLAPTPSPGGSDDDEASPLTSLPSVLGIVAGGVLVVGLVVGGVLWKKRQTSGYGSQSDVEMKSRTRSNSQVNR